MPQTETKNNLLVTVEVMLPSAIGVVGADRLGRGGLTGYGGTDKIWHFKTCDGRTVKSKYRREYLP